MKGSCSDKRSLSFWGIISSTRQKILVKCPDRLRSRNYSQILEKVGPEIFGVNTIFQQDNCLIQKANCVTSYLRENLIDALEWSAYSPDLNIIENLWAIVKKRLAKEILTEENLEEKVFSVWDQIPPEFVIKLYNSLPRRLNNVLKSEGAVTGC